MTDVINALKTAQQNTTPPAPFDLQVAVRRGRVRLRRRRMKQSGIGLAVTTAVAAAAFLLPGTTFPGPPEPAGEPTFAIFDEPQRAADELPPSVRPAGVEETSTRLVGEYQGLAYWLATSGEEGETCLVAAEDETRLGTSCATGWQGAGYGTADHGFVTAELFPDDMDVGIAEHAGLLFLSDNLAITTMSESEREALAGVLTTASEHYEVLAQPQRPEDRLPESVRNRYPDGTTRYLGEHGTSEYWIVAYRSGPSVLSICQVVVASDDESRGHFCRDEPDQYAMPTAIHDDEGTDDYVFMVPDDFDHGGDEEAADWTVIGPNLAFEPSPLEHTGRNPDL